jgi:hypothetical protein
MIGVPRQRRLKPGKPRLETIAGADHFALKCQRVGIGRGQGRSPCRCLRRAVHVAGTEPAPPQIGPDAGIGGIKDDEPLQLLPQLRAAITLRRRHMRRDPRHGGVAFSGHPVDRILRTRQITLDQPRLGACRQGLLKRHTVRQRTIQRGLRRHALAQQQAGPRQHHLGYA